MRNFASTALLAAIGLSFPIPAIAQEDELSRGEKELAKILEGRIAGEPVRCLNRHERDRLQVITDTALVFRDGDTIYVNRTNAPRFIDDFDVPVFDLFTSKLCNLDRVEFISRSGNIGGPVVIMEDFIPYTKPAEEEGSEA